MEEFTAILEWGMDALLLAWGIVLDTLQIIGMVILGLALYFVLWAIWRTMTTIRRKLQ